MSSRLRVSRAPRRARRARPWHAFAWRAIASWILAAAAAGCQRDRAQEIPSGGGVTATPVTQFRPATSDSASGTLAIDPRALPYFDNAEAVVTGKRLYNQYNCVGCHFNGGGGIGPPLMDDQWIYGGRLDQIFNTHLSGTPQRDAGMGDAPHRGADLEDRRVRALHVAPRHAERQRERHAVAAPGPGSSWRRHAASRDVAPRHHARGIVILRLRVTALASRVRCLFDAARQRCRLRVGRGGERRACRRRGERTRRGSARHRRAPARDGDVARRQDAVCRRQQCQSHRGVGRHRRVAACTPSTRGAIPSAS